MRGLCSHFDKQKEVKKLIQDEGLQFFAILETHVKCKNIKKTCETVFGNLECITNGEDNNKVFEHSNGSANPSSEMSDFQECVNSIEVDDLHSEGSLMVSKKRKGSFRFSNFTTDKEDFLPTIRSVWNKRFEGYTMYKVVHEMKALKRKLKQLIWKNGNVFERAGELRKKVKESKKDVDMFPHDERIKEKSCLILKDYHEAIQVENSLLCQKAKVELLKEGDRNTAYFHKTIKERVHRGRIMTITNEDGVRFENDDVSMQIVKHFEEFLGKAVKCKSCLAKLKFF
ncbi:hypothetical protein Tco_1187903 [Tanacetum coccineum]